jgi:rRNA maturation endonuclease Nob1
MSEDYRPAPRCGRCDEPCEPESDFCASCLSKAQARLRDAKARYGFPPDAGGES